MICAEYHYYDASLDLRKRIDKVDALGVSFHVSNLTDGIHNNRTIWLRLCLTYKIMRNKSLE